VGFADVRFRTRWDANSRKRRHRDGDVNTLLAAAAKVEERLANAGSSAAAAQDTAELAALQAQLNDVLDNWDA
jgi:hypothetical protein